MKLHADFSKRVEINTNEMEWIASPAGGVDRKMLGRIGDEKARATSIVRYAADSAFPEHEHQLGEEFYVLEGVFSRRTRRLSRRDLRSESRRYTALTVQQGRLYDFRETPPVRTKRRSAFLDQQGDSRLGTTRLAGIERHTSS